METEYAVKLNEKLVEKEESHKQELEHEKANWLIRTESEKNLLRHEFDKEKERLVLKNTFKCKINIMIT